MKKSLIILTIIALGMFWCPKANAQFGPIGFNDNVNDETLTAPIDATPFMAAAFVLGAGLAGYHLRKNRYQPKKVD